MPEQIEIAAYACVDEEMCRRVHLESVERLQ
jgi:hypothetical protein